ncbi:hypothetical protein ERX27_10810 [Macrococcus brunensis]|uniref:PLD phosphodiesterase domain-containing protein n=1 Tax=Macrococcus brunensis TaxID=198483 RepID=A0A4R6BAM9_9STAP|nr:hypothetical protein [Macrococcus brunensis]TDL93351.1 hypothetical protein ERX27_10810 [Macrococcus brunensis]
MTTEVQETFGLFEDDVQQLPDFLHVIHNGKVRRYDNYEEIFDSEKYDEIIGTSYSVGYKMINKIISHFSYVDFIVGISDQSYHQKLHDNIHYEVLRHQTKEKYIQQSGVTVFTEMNHKQKKKVLEGRANLKYPKPGVPIHCKFYLLRNSVNGSNRVIFGSANLSVQAFSNNISQFEDIIILDDHEYYEHYLKRYEYIKDNFTTDLIPPSVIRQYQEQEESQPFSGKSIDILKVMKEEVKKDVSDIQTLQTQMKEIIGVPEMIQDKLNYSDKEEHEALNIRKNVTEMMSLMTGMENKKLRFKNNTERTVENKLTKIFYTNTDKQDDDKELKHHRPFLNRWDNRLEINHYNGVFTGIGDKDNVQMEVPFNFFISDEEIIKSIRLIDQMMNSYLDHLRVRNLTAVSRIYEILLYAFTSPFLSYLHANIEEIQPGLNNREIPIFCIIGGAPGSGKTYLLKWINKLTSADKTPPYVSYGAMKGINSEGKEGTIAAIKKYLNVEMRQKNAYPLLVDEIEEKFFTEKSIENLLVHLSNELHLELEGKPFPVLIGTTNSSTYKMDQRATSRFYYLKVDIPFDEKKRVASSKTYKDIFRQTDNQLFRDFLSRYLKMLKETPYRIIESTDNKGTDFLYAAREIFKEYYRIAGLSLPIYFPQSIANDYSMTSREHWRDLFRNYYRNTDYFIYDASRDELTFLKNALYSGNMYNQQGISVYYLEMLPSYVYKQSQGEQSYLITIYGKEFFRWLEIPNPYSKGLKGFLNKKVKF